MGKLVFDGVAKFGDYTTNAALVLAGILKKNPMEMAEQIVELLNGFIIQEPSPQPSPKGRGGKSENSLLEGEMKKPLSQLSLKGRRGKNEHPLLKEKGEENVFGKGKGVKYLFFSL